ncbi:hypothetical protein NPX13_g5237 [Xylaria arbuscula]|uniref:Rhodopsin domain-containing protein n=1 Tax=Xylaria arbuscula TaxID=114810 RepID=A0A9W8TLH1_9PEZI|nr:hypothetical protein NPX13_g5237 [Xylaria arbuscula]
MADSLATTPAGVPPPGVEPNFLNPPSSANVLIIVGTVLLVIMLVFASIRFYVKVIVRRKVTADDWTTLAAVVTVTRAKFGTHMWDISVAHTLGDDFLIASFFTNWPTGLVWAFAKTSFFLMYLQIFGPLPWLRVCVYIGLTVNWLFYTIVVIASFAYQVPNAGQTWQEGFLNPRYNDAFRWTIPIASGSLILDTYIFILPVIAIFNLQLQVKKKLGVIAVFATGLLACVASSLSIVFKQLLDNHLGDYTYWIYPVLLTALVEMCVGISASCMPSTAGFFKGSKEIWGRRSNSALSSLRGLFGGRKNSSTTTRDDDHPWRGVNSHPELVGKNHYVDVHGDQSSTHELTTGEQGRNIHGLGHQATHNYNLIYIDDLFCDWWKPIMKVTVYLADPGPL